MKNARTTREQIANTLRAGPETASSLATEFGISQGTAMGHVQHVARTVDGTDEEVLVRPPQCRDCGYDGFDDILNLPSRCPECKSENVEEPAFQID